MARPRRLERACHRPLRDGDRRPCRGRAGRRRRTGHRLARRRRSAPSARASRRSRLIREALASLEGTTAPPEVVADLQARLGHALVFSGHADEATAADRGGAHLGPAPRARRAARLRPQLEGHSSQLSPGAPRRPARSSSGVVSVARRHGITRAEMMAEAQPRRPLHDPRPSGCRRARQGRARPRPALGTARARGCGGGQPHVRPHDGRAPRRGATGSGPSSSRRVATSVPGQRTSTSGSLIWRRFAATSRPPVSTLVGCGAWAESDDVQDRAMYAAAEAAVSLAEGDSRHALETARGAIDEAMRGGLGVAHEAVRLAFPIALEAAIDARRPRGGRSARRDAGGAPTRRGPSVPPGAGHPRQGARRWRTR